MKRAITSIPIPGKGAAMNGAKVMIDFGEDSGLGKEQQSLLAVLERQLEGRPFVLSTSGKVGDKVVPVYNFLVTLKRVQHSQLATG